MGAAATLSDELVRVEPGGEAVCQITVRNTGTVVDQFGVEVIGDVAPWVTVEPARVSLFPGTEQAVEVRFRPPRAAHVLAGVYPFALKVVPQEDVAGTVVEEGTLTVSVFVDTMAELLPRTSRGRRGAVHEVAVDNRGNQRVNARLSAADADEQLLFRLDPPAVVVEPGQAAFARVRIRPKRRYWRGPPQTRPFQVVVEPDEGLPLAVDGTMLHEPRIPKWLPKALLAALLLLIALAVLWYTLLRPTLEAAAKQAVEEEIAAVQEEAAAAGAAAAAAEEKAAAAEERAAAAEETASVAEEQAGEAAASAGAGAQAAGLTEQFLASRDFGDPFDFRLSRATAPGTQAVAAQPVQQSETFALTDIVLQNPQGDRGVVQIRRRTVAGVVSVLLEVRLENFRDLDYHFVSPVLYQPGEEVQLLTSCDNQAEGASGLSCNASAYFSGFRKVLPAEGEDDVEEPAEG